MKISKQFSFESTINPYSLKNSAVNRITNQTTVISAKAHELEALRLSGKELHASIEGIEKILASSEPCAYN